VLFAASAIEITIRQLLVKPMLNGLVHNETVAELVMELTPREVGSEGFKDLLFGVLKRVACLDLATYKRSGSNRTLWDECNQLRRERNRLIHEGVSPSAETLNVFDSVAIEFLNVIFPQVLRSPGLEVKGYLMIRRQDKTDSLA
jgi:hypothetical protein